MNSSFPNRWSFSYLKFTKYVTNIIAEPKYKYGQQEQVTVRNHRLGTVSIKILAHTEQSCCVCVMLMSYYETPYLCPVKVVAYWPFYFLVYGIQTWYVLVYGIWGSLFQHIKFSKAFTLENLKKNIFHFWHISRFIFLLMAYGNPQSP